MLNQTDSNTAPQVEAALTTALDFRRQFLNRPIRLGQVLIRVKIAQVYLRHPLRESADGSLKILMIRLS